MAFRTYRKPFEAVAAVIAALIIAALASRLRQPFAPTNLGVVGVGLAAMWMASTTRTGWALAALALYLGLLDGFLKLRTGSTAVTVGRDVLMLALCLGALVRLQQRPSLPRLPPLTGLVAAFVALVLIEILNPSTSSIGSGLAATRQHIEWIPLFFFGYSLNRDANALRGLFWVLLVVAAINGIVSVVQFQLGPQAIASWGPGYARLINGTDGLTARVFFDPSGAAYVRPFGLGSDSGFGGLMAMLALPGGLALAMTTRKRSQLLLLGVLFSGAILALVTSQERSAVIGALVGVLAFMVLAISKQRLVPTLAAALAGIVIVVLVGTATHNANGGVFRRITDLAPSHIVATVSPRAGTLGLIPSYATRFPLGAGLGSVGPAQGRSLSAIQKALDAESEPTFLEIELGIPGLLLWSGILLAVLALAFSRMRVLTATGGRALLAGVAAPLVAILVAGLGSVVSAAPPEAPYFWFAAGVIVAWLGRPRGMISDGG